MKIPPLRDMTRMTYFIFYKATQGLAVIICDWTHHLHRPRENSTIHQWIWMVEHVTMGDVPGCPGMSINVNPA